MWIILVASFARAVLFIKCSIPFFLRIQVVFFINTYIHGADLAGRIASLGTGVQYKRYTLDTYIYFLKKLV